MHVLTFVLKQAAPYFLELNNAALPVVSKDPWREIDFGSSLRLFVVF